MWEVRYPVLEQAAQQTQHPVALALRGKTALEWAECGRRHKNWLSSRLLHTVLLQEQPVMRKRDETSSVKAGGLVWQEPVMTTFCVWCPVIYHDKIPNGMGTINDSQLGKERNKSCCPQLWFRWSNSASLIMQLLAFNVIYGKSEFEQICWVCSIKGRDRVFICTHTPP